ncbi:hypothetical protein Sango_0352100 [Sesamum angolense]|uniref:Transposase n=1 Tax=Sesamum angolense TaxID=2727404 RepID=A0AAE1X9H7_9LAMI|nr:hypothetical protein Sango_0352100 [Sesamum angolense]
MSLTAISFVLAKDIMFNKLIRNNTSRGDRATGIPTLTRSSKGTLASSESKEKLLDTSLWEEFSSRPQGTPPPSRENAKRRKLEDKVERLNTENAKLKNTKKEVGCLGASDGTHIRVRVPVEDKPRYRTRKNKIATNVLGVCSQDMQFIYVLPGWEGSAANSRVLRDAISRRNGFVVPRGSYYLVDDGYTNGDGFLAPFQGQRYHLNDWSERHQPTTAEEFFNMRHASARNIIERMDIPTQETRGRGKNKRKWKYEEDAKLVEALLDMVNVGAYKAENGFKPGYLNYVEEKMQVSLPNSGLKAKPHIESRIKTLRRDFNIVYDMLNGSNTSGFGFDPIKKCVTAEKAVWEAYLQSHSTHVIWQNKPIPFYDDLLVIFGKDRATENNADGPADMMEEIQREEVNNDPNDDVETTIENGLEDLDEGIKEAASVIGSEIAKASQLFSKAIRVEAEVSEKRQKIDSEIRKIPNLTATEVIKVV